MLMPSDSWALYGSIAVGSVRPWRHVPPGFPGLIWTSGDSGQPAAWGWLAPLAGPPPPVFSFLAQPASASTHGGRRAPGVVVTHRARNPLIPRDGACRGGKRRIAIDYHVHAG